MATSQKPAPRGKSVQSNGFARRRMPNSAPPPEALRAALTALLWTPSIFTPRRLPEQKRLFRERILTLPTMVAIVVSLVLRQVASLAEVVRLLGEEGLLWVQAVNVSRQALSKRLARLPASLFARLFEEVLPLLRDRSPAVPVEADSLLHRFSAVRIADGSTMEALRKRLKDAPPEAPAVGGKVMMTLDIATHLPVSVAYTEDALANDKTLADPVVESLPKGGLLLFDLGFFSFPFFDRFTDDGKYFLTRLREKTAFKEVRVLSQAERYRDRIIQMGLRRSYPCEHPVRLVEVLWNGAWYRYLTNVLDPQLLSAREVCDLYRRRWRIEDAFLLTKHHLGLAYLWVGGSNGVQIQMFATLIFYAVLTTLCREVAAALSQPLERISVEMVFRSFYYYGRATERGETADIVTYIALRAQMLGVVKAIRKRHRDAQLQQQDIWGG